ncbi:nucleoside-diphosphate sugar epimerase/dehydratase [Opitutales bacterium ASA1]|uniref:polysaccharide biosynthesis protein n=1 Tax=Congregicoccus parvus TaxID=3081749 RepID=UPI002B2BF5D9|nr:nucleoside-diphosphate sugar epimerase/dehydratase [Opitutales bacterium ASA1]
MNALQRVGGRLMGWASLIVGPRPGLRAAIMAVVYGIVVAVAFAAAYGLRWDFEVPEGFRTQCLQLIGAVVLTKVLLLAIFGQMRAVLSYFSLHDFGCVFAASMVATIGMFVLWLVSEPNAGPPRGVILIDGFLTLGGLAGLRLGFRLVCGAGRSVDGRSFGAPTRRVGIVGAGDTGAALANDLLTKRSFGMLPAFFLDDDSRKWNRRLHGVKIHGPITRLAEIAAKEQVQEIILTIPGAGPRKVQSVVQAAQQAGLKTSIVPSFTQLAAGDVQVDRFRPVELEDLLGREPAELDSAGIDELVRGQTVLVTGAGGSIGSELCRQIAARKPHRLLLLDQSEVQLFQIEQELVGAGHDKILVTLVADVMDAARLYEIFDEHRPEVVFHAAAHKHVFMMERQPGEAVKNNFLGTHRLAQAARQFETRRFVLISTDKAINPTSVMGATKRLAEYAVLGNHSRSDNRTRFMAVRFGNVLGSSGSVIPIFRKQIAAGGPVTVTHPDVTRYFMTIPEAVGLVLQAATMGEGGEVFVLDMGTPMKIADVARQLIHLSGFRPDVDIEVKFVGLRPGEKLYEELQHTGENLAPTSHSRVMRLRGTSLDAGRVEQCHAEIAGAVYSVDADELKLLIKKWVPEYTPCFIEGNHSADQRMTKPVAAALSASSANSTPVEPGSSESEDRPIGLRVVP